MVFFYLPTVKTENPALSANKGRYFTMVYQVMEWAFLNPAYCIYPFTPITEANDAMKQAIVNSIRENGYIFETLSHMYPVLNTGEIVWLSDELCEELVCRAYDFTHEEYALHLNHASRPPCEPTSTHAFVPVSPMRHVIYVRDEAFDGLRESLLSGESNVELLPYSSATMRVAMRPGDVLRILREDESDHLELRIRSYAPGGVMGIADLINCERTDTESLLQLLDRQDACPTEQPLCYRYAGLPGQQIYEEFQRIYGIWPLQMAANGDFNCKIDAVVFDREADFHPTVLDAPQDMPLSEQMREEIRQQYEASVQEQEAARAHANATYLRLKEKMAQRKREQQNCNG